MQTEVFRTILAEILKQLLYFFEILIRELPSDLNINWEVTGQYQIRW